MYTALTIQIGRRKKRGIEDIDEADSACDSGASFQSFYGCHLSNFLTKEEDTVWSKVADVLWHG